MTFAQIKATGIGSLRFRLAIEGWPEEFVTDASITHATNKDGRSVYPGLSYRNLQIGDRVILQEAKIQADGITFLIVPCDGFERPLQSFGNYPTPVAMLGTAIDSTETSFSGKLVGGGSLSNNTVYHMGTEAFRVGTWPTVTRRIWSTNLQTHNVSDTNATRAVYVYRRPPSMEGRRAWLYVYGGGDDVAGDGTIIWRGIVSRPPQIDSDGLTWRIECEPITRLLAQQVAGAIQEAHPFGIYHHWSSCFAFAIGYNDAQSDVYRLSKIHDTEADFLADVNDLLETARTDLGISEIPANGLFLDHRVGESFFSINVTPNADMPNFWIDIGSPIIGTTSTGVLKWTREDNNKKYLGIWPTTGGERLAADKKYFAELARGGKGLGAVSFVGWDDGYSYDGEPVSPLGGATMLLHGIMHGNVQIPGESFFTDPDSEADFPANRIYVDQDMTGAEAVYIPDTFSPTGIYPVETIDVDADGRNYIEVTLYQGIAPRNGLTRAEWEKATMAQQGFDGFLSGGTTINAVRKYTTLGSVCDFVQALKDQAVDANDGDTPQITDEDLTTWAFGDSGLGFQQTLRNYMFVKPHSLEEILAEECKLTMHFMRIESTGLIGFQPLPTYSDATTVDDAHTLDASVIVTPADDYGIWPGWTPQRDGLVSMVEIKDVFSPVDDDWKDRPIIFQDPDAIATHKGRGKAKMTIAPYSAPVALPGPADQATFKSIAQAYLGLFSTDYAVVTLQVPFKCFDVICGDVVLITHDMIPFGDGTRGVTGKTGIVLSRRWFLDPGVGQCWGEFSVLVALEPLYGYAPSAYITAQTDNGGNNWTLTCSTANAYNLAWSNNNDGKCLEHFHAGDFIQIMEYNGTGTSPAVGVVVGTPNAAAGTVVVQLEGVWTPGIKLWTLEFRENPDDAHATAEQKKFVYSANTGLTDAAGTFARRFA